MRSNSRAQLPSRVLGFFVFTLAGTVSAAGLQSGGLLGGRLAYFKVGDDTESYVPISGMFRDPTLSVTGNWLCYTTSKLGESGAA